MPRADLTLLLLTRDALVRADYRGRAPREPIGVWEQVRPETDDLATLVEVGLAGEPPAKNVWLLSTDVWTQVLLLPKRAVVGMDEVALRGVLAYEAESTSGIPAIQAAVAVVPANAADVPVGEVGYRIAVLPQVDMVAADDLLRSMGSRLRGVVHPGGLKRPLMVPPGDTWQRVEFWQEATFLVQPDVHVAPPVLQPDRWKDEAESWRRRRPLQGAWEVFTPGHGVFTLSHELHFPIEVDAREAFLKLLTAWAFTIQNGQVAAPTLHPPAKPRKPVLRYAITALLFAGVVGVCGYHHVTNAQALKRDQDAWERAKTEFAQAEQVQKDTKKIDDERTKLEKDVGALTKKIQDAEAGLATYQKRKAALLDLLTKHLPADTALRRIETKGNDLIVHGWSTEPGAPNRYARALTEPAKTLGWNVQTPKIDETKPPVRVDGVVVFEMMFQEIPLPAGKSGNTPIVQGD